MGREAEKATLLKTVSLVPLLARSGFRPRQRRRYAAELGYSR